jgi:hypothetical protein
MTVKKGKPPISFTQVRILIASAFLRLHFESTSAIGYHVGVSYRSNGFFYWQAGARFNSAAYELISATSFTDTLDNAFSVTAIDIPITGGINFLSVTNRIFNIRAFISAVPSFALGVGNNELLIEKSAINTFNFYGQGGIGFDVLFLVIEGGFNYGFSDLLKNGKAIPARHSSILVSDFKDNVPAYRTR